MTVLATKWPQIEQAFASVCKVLDEHPELWERPSRDAVTFPVDALRKKKD
jgi:hypothetical protein